MAGNKEPQGFMHGVYSNFHHFLDTYQEWHALVIGLADGFAFTKTPWETIKSLKKELHYYKGGVFVGRLAFVIAVGLIIHAIGG